MRLSAPYFITSYQSTTYKSIGVYIIDYQHIVEISFSDVFHECPHFGAELGQLNIIPNIASCQNTEHHYAKLPKKSTPNYRKLE